MGDSDRKRWLSAAILIGVLYTAVGVTTAALAGSATTTLWRSLWRASAFGVSGLVVVAHVVFEHFRFGRAVRDTAQHVFFAAALGGLGLAVVANIHDLYSASGYRPRLLIALVAWPLLTGVPAFFVAFVLGMGLRKWRASA